MFRYENTVTAQFYGHTHTDEIDIYYDSETKQRPVSVGYIGPSVTTFVDGNPAYRIYAIDGDHKDSSYVSGFIFWVSWTSIDIFRVIKLHSRMLLTSRDG